MQTGQGQAAGALDALGGTSPAGTEGTAAQQFGRQFRGVLDSAAQDSKQNASHLYDAIDPDGTLAVNMQPARQAAQTIMAKMPQNAAPLSGEEKAIFDTMQALPDAQSYREMGALNNRVTTAMRAARSDPAQAQSYARLSQLRSGLADILQDTAEGKAASDTAAVQAGTLSPEQTMMARWKAEQQDFYARQAADRIAAGGNSGSNPQGYAGGGSRPVSGDGRAEVSSNGRFGDASRNPGVSGKVPPLTANTDQAALDRINAANANYAEHKATFGAKAPGVGPVLAPGPTAGTFKMADSAVPSAIFSRGAGAAERVRAAVRAGLSPQQIAQYAAFDLRRTASNTDGSLNPVAAAKWRQNNSEAFQALTQADPSMRCDLLGDLRAVQPRRVHHRQPLWLRSLAGLATSPNRKTGQDVRHSDKLARLLSSAATPARCLCPLSPCATRKLIAEAHQ